MEGFSPKSEQNPVPEKGGFANNPEIPQVGTAHSCWSILYAEGASSERFS